VVWWSERVGPNPDTTAALQHAALLLAHTPPYTGVLPGLQRPAQALIGHGAAPADRLRLLDLQQSRAGRPDREEQLRIFVAADRTVAPVHGGYAPCSVAVMRKSSLYAPTETRRRTLRPATREHRAPSSVRL